MSANITGTWSLDQEINRHGNRSLLVRGSAQIQISSASGNRINISCVENPKGGELCQPGNAFSSQMPWPAGTSSTLGIGADGTLMHLRLDLSGKKPRLLVSARKPPGSQQRGDDDDSGGEWGGGRD